MGSLVSLPRGEIPDKDSYKMKAQESFIQILFPLIIGILFFLTALGINQAVGLTIDRYFHDISLGTSTTQNVLVGWAYSIIIAVVLVALVYFSNRYIHAGKASLDAHGESGPELAELPVEAI